MINQVIFPYQTSTQPETKQSLQHGCFSALNEPLRRRTTGWVTKPRTSDSLYAAKVYHLCSTAVWSKTGCGLDALKHSCTYVGWKTQCTCIQMKADWSHIPMKSIALTKIAIICSCLFSVGKVGKNGHLLQFLQVLKLFSLVYNKTHLFPVTMQTKSL